MSVKKYFTCKQWFKYFNKGESTFGACGSDKPVFYRDIHAIIDTGMKKRDRSISIFFGSQGISVEVTPYPEEEKDETSFWDKVDENTSFWEDAIFMMNEMTIAQKREAIKYLKAQLNSLYGGKKK